MCLCLPGIDENNHAKSFKIDFDHIFSYWLNGFDVAKSETQLPNKRTQQQNI